MNKQRLYIIVAAGFGMLATFLPWIRISDLSSINGTAGEGWINLILFGITIFITAFGDTKERMNTVNKIAVLIPNSMAIVIGLWKIYSYEKIFTATNSEENPFHEIFNSSISIGYGLYLVIIAGISVYLVTFFVKEKKKVTQTNQ